MGRRVLCWDISNTYERSIAYITAMDTIAGVVSIPPKTVTCTSLPSYPPLPPGTPSSITVPTTSTTATYTVAWTAPVGTVTSYELQQATDSNFTAPVLSYSGTALSKSITATKEGPYYYRVRACNTSGCSNYLAGANGITIPLFPPGTPSSITFPTSGVLGVPYQITWGAASGTLTAYYLEESDDSTFPAKLLCSMTAPPSNCTGTLVLYYGLSQSAYGPSSKRSRVAKTYYYRVKACNNLGCSAYRTGSHSVVVK